MCLAPRATPFAAALALSVFVSATVSLAQPVPEAGEDESAPPASATAQPDPPSHSTESPPAVAEPTPPVEPPRNTADTAAAEALFQLGKALMDSGKVDEGCAKFAASMRAEPAGGTLLNLALCHQLQGKVASAWAEYRKASELIRAGGQPERADEAMRLAVDLEPKLSKITMSAAEPVPGLSILRGGVPVGMGALGVAVPVDPGRYEIVASAPGYHSWSTTVVIGENADRKSVVVPVLDKAPPAATRASSPPAGLASEEFTGDYQVPYVTGIVMAAVGGAGVGVGAILGGLAAGDVNDAEGDPALCGPDKRCGPEGQELIDSARGKATAATLLIGIGAATVVSGLVLVLTTGTYRDGDAGADDATAQWVPVVGPSSAGLSFSGAF